MKAKLTQICMPKFSFEHKRVKARDSAATGKIMYVLLCTAYCHS